MMRGRWSERGERKGGGGWGARRIITTRERERERETFCSSSFLHTYIIPSLHSHSQPLGAYPDTSSLTGGNDDGRPLGLVSRAGMLRHAVTPPRRLELECTVRSHTKPLFQGGVRLQRFGKHQLTERRRRRRKRPRRPRGGEERAGRSGKRRWRGKQLGRRESRC